MGQLATTYQQSCLTPLGVAGAKVNDANTRDIAGWSAVGVGGAGAIVGLVLFVTADPHAFDRPAGTGGTTPVLWGTRGGGGLSETFVW
jgi:hypothetical protein